jgi:hypothetical protein
MATKGSSSKKTASKAAPAKKSLKVKDLAPKKDPKGGSTDHPPGKKDY